MEHRDETHVEQHGDGDVNVETPKPSEEGTDDSPSEGQGEEQDTSAD